MSRCPFRKPSRIIRTCRRRIPVSTALPNGERARKKAPVTRRVTGAFALRGLGIFSFVPCPLSPVPCPLFPIRRLGNERGNHARVHAWRHRLELQRQRE